MATAMALFLVTGLLAARFACSPRRYGGSDIGVAEKNKSGELEIAAAR